MRSCSRNLPPGGRVWYTGRMKRCVLPLLVALALPALAALVPVAPEEGGTVPLLKASQKKILALTHAQREPYFDDAQPAMRKKIASCRSEPLPVTLAWRGGEGPYEVSVRKSGTKKPFFTAHVPTNTVEVWNLEVGATYRWTVKAGTESIKGSFRTERTAPRLIRVPKVPNIRDLGGRTGLDGRRIRQGMVYRSAGLNDNAPVIHYTLDEVLQLEKDGKLASLGRTGKRYSDKLRAGKKLDPKYLRLVKAGPDRPGKARLTDETRAYMRTVLGVRTDIDLRTDAECFGMTGSPLGDGVRWVHVPYHGYASVHAEGTNDTREVFRVFLDPKNYPIDFHCIGGADRTGTVAALLEGLLGVSEEDIWRDYQTTAFIGGINDSRHLQWFTDFVKSFGRYEGATLADRIARYFLALGFTEKDIAAFREIMLEQKKGTDR